MNINKKLKKDIAFSQYGSSMGRSDWHGPSDLIGKFYLQKIIMCNCCGAYDSGGAYWGIGQQLYCGWCVDPMNHDEQVRLFIRADSREEAAEKIKSTYKSALFFK
jgi:hypothetical protein